MTLPSIESVMDRLMAALETLPDQWPLTGGVVAVTSRDTVHAIRPFGRAGLGAREPVGPQHLFEIGSISKIFTGLLVLDLAEEGQCDLDAPARHYLPWLEIASAHPPFTLRHLLQHTAGLIKGSEDPPDELGQAWMAREGETGSPPGSVFHYSNLGYVLLGLVIRAVSGTPAPDLCQQRLLGPMGMTRTLPRVQNRHRSLLAEGIVPAADDRPWFQGAALAPAPWLEVEACDGNIASTGDDLARFLRMLLGRGVLDGKRIVSEQNFQRLIGDLAVAGEDWSAGFGAAAVTQSHYGLGINVETVAGHHCLSHGGGMVGYSSFVLADLTADLGIAVLTNANGDYPVGQIIARLAHRLLIDPEATLPSFDLSLSTASPGFDRAMLGSFLGVDTEGRSHAITVGEREGSLHLSDGEASGRLFRGWGARFASDHPAFARFPLSFDTTQQGWLHGGLVLRQQPPKPLPGGDEVERLRPHVGRYRSYSPWFPSFRLVLRGQGLWLIAAGGVEAPSEDVELVELEPGLFRLGREETNPERLRTGPAVEGQTILVWLDGSRYSRMSTD
ncbi:serine hydrolase domain-containing protein [Labrys neptuniae]